jgi:hypothetical protein
MISLCISLLYLYSHFVPKIIWIKYFHFCVCKKITTVIMFFGMNITKEVDPIVQC